MIRVGPAGWSYPDWEGKVYPQVKPAGFHALGYLARYFGCIEINSTFYAMPRREHAERWVDEVKPWPEFRFLVKLNRAFTHEPERDAAHGWEDDARAFVQGIEPLQRARKLSGVLAQFPTSLLHGKHEVRRLGRLRALFEQLPLVLEVRHDSWFTPPALSTVRGLGYSLAYIDLPKAWNHPPDWHAPTGPIGYLRLHGRNSTAWFRRESGRDDKYDYLYSSDEVRELAGKALRIASMHADTYVVTNNHFAGKAAVNGLEILAELEHRTVSAPPELVQSYPRLQGVARAEGQQQLF